MELDARCLPVSRSSSLSLMLLLDFNTKKKKRRERERMRREKGKNRGFGCCCFDVPSPWRHIHLLGKQRSVQTHTSQILHMQEHHGARVQLSSGSFQRVCVCVWRGVWGGVMICISFSRKCDRREGAVRKAKMSELTNYNWGSMNFYYFTWIPSMAFFIFYKSKVHHDWSKALQQRDEMLWWLITSLILRWN